MLTRGIAAIAAALVLGLAVEAADYPYQSAVLKNSTNARITYYYKLGNGGWNQTALDPGKSHYFAFPNRPGVDTRVFIAFDRTRGDGKPVWQYEQLWMGTTNKPQNGRFQHFTVNGSTIVLSRY